MNIFSSIPETLPDEVFEDLAVCRNVRIERILSRGHTSPDEGWYDQSEDEWVIVLKGEGELEFEDGERRLLKAGDHIMINKHVKHKVSWTKPEEVTIWLAIFIS